MTRSPIFCYNLHVLSKRWFHLAVQTFVFDLDGVVYRGEQPLPGAVDSIEALRRLGHQVYFFTNNSTHTRTTYAEKLARMGVPADEDHIMTSAYATALYLTEKGARGASVFVVGEEGPREELRAAGLKLVEDGLDEKVDYVVAGLDRKFDYDTLTKAQHAILAGAEFIATNRDATFPLEEGLIVPGSGALVSAIEAAAGVTPILIGKPETYAMCKVLELAHASPENSVVVGDRLDTDVLVGKRIGAITVLVLTGVTTEEDLASAPPELRPDVVVHGLSEMLGKLSAFSSQLSVKT